MKPHVMKPHAARSMVVIATLASLILSAGCRDGSKSSDHVEHELGDSQASGGHTHGHQEGEPAPLPANFHGPGQLSLPEDLRGLIVAEMLQVETAMHRILSALVRGELDTVASTARQVHDSFVLEQKLTPDQTTTLTKVLPPEFVSLDRTFHLQAQHLEKAAKAGNAAEASEVYSRMSKSCVGCHRAYARTRFPGLAPEGPLVHEPGHNE